MNRNSKRFAQKAWDPVNARYASLDYPEWVTCSRLPVFFWEDPHNHHRYIRWLAKELGIKNLDDWYKVKSKDFTNRRAYGFLEYYEHSHIKALQSLFPSHDWKCWLFPQAPSGFWDELSNCAKFVAWFEKQQGIKKKSDWYPIQQDDIYALHGAGLMDHFNCSVPQLLAAVYPKYDWQLWRFPQAPNNFWQQKRNRVAYLKWLGKKLGYRKIDDWYQVTKRDFFDNKGGSLMQMNGHTPIELVRELYPRRRWLQWKFKQVSQGYWTHQANRVEYLQWLGEQLGYKNSTDWLSVRRQDFADNHGGSLLADFYKTDISRSLKELYPSGNWLPWKFHQVPVGFWDESRNCREYLRWLAQEMGFSRKADWYGVRRADFRNNFGTGFIKRFKTPYKGLMIAYPKYDWLPWMFENVPVGFWAEFENRAWYLRWLGKQLRLRTASGWRQLSAKQLRGQPGQGILSKIPLRQIRVEGESIFSNG